MLVKPTHSTPLRLVAWACVLAVLLAAAVPGSAGLPPAIPVPPAPAFAETGPSVLIERVDETPRPAPIALPAGARAPPLA
jgi:hypothetical protein